MITILADKNIPFLSDYLPDTFQLHLFDPDTSFTQWIDDSNRVNVQGLLIRTVSNISVNNPDLTYFPNLKFIGTASAGIDHVDTDHLTKNGVHFSSAAGCNANAVGEYVTTAVLHWSLSNKLDISSLQIGIIGMGKTGSSVYHHLNGLGCSCILYDPPRSIREKEFKSATLKELMKCDVLTFHVPLTKESQTDYPTFKWLKGDKLEKFNGKLIINASRGEVVEESALMIWKSTDSDKNDFIIDVWESEPNINVEFAMNSWIATPHIAGYSNQSKRNATRLIVEELAHYFNLPMSDSNKAENDTEVSKQEHFAMTLEAIDNTVPNEITILEHLHPMFCLSQDMKSGLSESSVTNINLFRSLRTHSKLRDEYKTLSANQIQSFQHFPQIYKLLMISKGSM